MVIPEQMYIGISKSRLTELISFLAVLVISERFSCIEEREGEGRREGGREGSGGREGGGGGREGGEGREGVEGEREGVEGEVEGEREGVEGGREGRDTCGGRRENGERKERRMGGRRKEGEGKEEGMRERERKERGVQIIGFHVFFPYNFIFFNANISTAMAAGFTWGLHHR